MSWALSSSEAMQRPVVKNQTLCHHWCGGRWYRDTRLRARRVMWPLEEQQRDQEEGLGMNEDADLSRRWGRTDDTDQLNYDFLRFQIAGIKEALFGCQIWVKLTLLLYRITFLKDIISSWHAIGLSINCRSLKKYIKTAWHKSRELCVCRVFSVWHDKFKGKVEASQKWMEHTHVCVCVRAKHEKGSSVRDYVTPQMSRATDGSGQHKGLMDRWFVSSSKVNRSVLLRRQAEAELPESHVSRFYWTKWASNVQLEEKITGRSSWMYFKAV